MQLSQLFKPWLGAHIVVLLTPPMGLNLNTLNAWVNRGLIQHMGERHTGKNVHRRYSLASAVQIHAMHVAARHGATLMFAAGIGEAAIQRLVACNDPEDSSPAALHTEDHVLLCWRQDTSVAGQVLSPAALARQIEQTGMPGNNPFAMVLEVDHLLDIVWQNYHDVTPELNEKALAGQLKPFPKSIAEGLACVDQDLKIRA